MVASSYYLQIISLIYIILLAIVFYTKKIKQTADSKVFSQLIFVVFLSIIFDIGCVFTKSLKNEIHNYYMNKFFLLTIVEFVLIFTEYITIVVNGEKNEEKRIKIYDKIHLKSNVIFIIWTVLFLYISNFYSVNNRETGEGIIVLYCALSWAICIGYWIIIMSRYIIREIGDELNFLKIPVLLIKIFLDNLLPIAIAIVPGTIGMLIQFIIPDLHIIVPLFALAVINMYFTIFPLENPDVKLIEEMKNAQEEAERANQSKTDFLSNVSHEIRTPLNAILGFSQTLLEENISDSVREEVEYIVSSSETLLEIVNEILDISKIESNKLEIVNVDYDVEKTYRSLLSSTEQKIGSRQLQFIHNYDTKLPPVLYGDYVRIKQIAQNLLNNAVKYTEQGFIKLRFESQDIEKDKCRLVISVTDSGIGIKDENLEKIFSKFDGLELKKDVEVEGTGLGLSLTKKLVNMMDGKIVVQSIQGEGSTFTVSIPQKISNKTKEQLSADDEQSIQRTFVGNGQKILIVDDNPVNLKVAIRLMKPYNLNIETLSSGKECIDRIQSGKKYDLVMLDDMMPEMSGIETLDFLKTNTAYKMKTIALTANAITGMKDKYMDAGFDDYLAKPINKKVLEDLLARHLGSAKEIDNNVSKSNQTVNIIDNNASTNTNTNSENATKSANPLPQSVEKPKAETNNAISAPQESINTIENEKLNKDFLTKNGVDLNKAIEFLGDMEMYDETVSDFLDEIDQKLSDIEKFYQEEDMPNYAILVHSLKSDSKYIGLMDLADLAYKHEMASKANDINTIKESYNDLINLARQKIDILKRYIGH